MEDDKVDVIIPLYRPDKKLEKLIMMLYRQDITPNKIILLNTEVLPDFSDEKIRQRIDRISGKTAEIEIIPIKKEEFDHGRTRALGAAKSEAQYMLFMTQDAVPKNETLIRKLLVPFTKERVAVSYGRQIARKNAGVVESYTRIFNYPERSYIKGIKDLDTLGIKTYFCSNVCAMYKKEYYVKLGGFVRKTIFNEDMIFAAEAVKAGFLIAYAADAVVIHSHEYTFLEQMHRNFDLGVSQAEHPEVFKKVPSEKEGVKMVKQTISYLNDQKQYMEIITFMIESAFKYAGYFLGKRYQMLPKSACEKLSMNKAYWRNYV